MNQLKGFLKKKLPKQIAPVMRFIEPVHWSKAAGVESAAAKNPCYRLTGLGRTLCMMYYGS